MLIVFFDKNGVVHSEFVPEGQTVNGAFYVEVLKRLRSDESTDRIFLFPKVKTALKGRHYGTLDDVKRACPYDLKDVSVGDFQGAYEAWKRRLQKFVIYERKKELPAFILINNLLRNYNMLIQCFDFQSGLCRPAEVDDPQQVVHIPGVKSLLYSLASFAACSFISLFEKDKEGFGSPVVKVSDYGRHAMSSSPVPLNTSDAR
ncbi:uncharacterized protein TNCV_4264561 [Trichonephila clavipes]|nr:uncharacterized protein TNCV_4264561 [Trichonephila clavipes]